MRRALIAITIVASLTVGGTASAQRAIHFGIGGGPAFPTGTFHNDHSTGWNGLGAVIIGFPESFYGLRFDYSTNEFAGRQVLGQKYHSTKAPAVTANMVGTFPLGSIKPYVVAGGGWYPYQEATDTKRDNDFGMNGGAGITFPLLVGAGFLEGRYHSVSGRKTAHHFVPVTFGILF